MRDFLKLCLGVSNTSDTYENCPYLSFRWLINLKPLKCSHAPIVKVRKLKLCKDIPTLNRFNEKLKGHPPSADLRYGGKDNITPSTLVFATRKG